MPGTVVSRLRLRVPPGHATRARVGVEDALQAADDEERLLVLRRLDLGRMTVHARATDWIARAAAGISEQRARAVHAAAPGAASADAVWFRSAEEARTLLLLELVSGRLPSAWFWRVAVGEWGGVPLSLWLARLVAHADREPRYLAALGRASVAVAAAGYLPGLAAALAVAPVPHGNDISLPAEAVGPMPRRKHHTRTRDAGERAQAILHRHPGATRLAFMTAIAGERPFSAKGDWLARFALVGAAPELASQPAQLAELADALRDLAVNGKQPAVGIRTEPSSHALVRPEPAQAESAIGPIQAATGPDPGDVGPPAPSSLPAASNVQQSAADRPATAASPTEGVMAGFDELASAGAGLFLVVRPLTIIGFPEWLDRHPAMAADGFARSLLHSVALRLHIDPEDPLFALLDARDAPEWHGAVTAWRIGVDRWLRRIAGIKLCEVVCRRGWIATAGESVTIRFRVDTADIRLRRRALDIDPGWTPWLGWVVAYRYRDEPPG